MAVAGSVVVAEKVGRKIGGQLGLVKDRDAVVVFVSDHGEEAYDYRAMSGRSPIDTRHKAQYAHCQHDVPLWVWCSEKYEAAHPAVAADVRAAAARPLTSDRLGHLMLRLGLIDSPYYRAGHDVSSRGYRPARRTIHLAGGGDLDYDIITGR